MARAYRNRHPQANWLGIEIDPVYAELARQHSQQVLVGDVEQLIDDPAVAPLLQAQRWVFGESLEYFRDPWNLLRKVQSLLPEGGVVCGSALASSSTRTAGSWIAPICAGSRPSPWQACFQTTAFASIAASHESSPANCHSGRTAMSQYLSVTAGSLLSCTAPAQSRGGCQTSSPRHRHSDLHPRSRSCRDCQVAA